jgi:RNA polymerase sigma-70 factor (ECF subfamily)
MELEAQRTDQAIIEAVLGGDPEAYSLLAERYSARLFGLAFHLCGDYDSASDLVQETLVAAYDNLGRLQDLSAFPAWIAAILRNKFRSLGRKKPAAFSLDQMMEAGFDPPSRQAPPGFTDEDLASVAHCVESLPGKYRETLLLRYTDNLSYKEIAGLLDLPVTTVTTRLNQARRMLVAKAKEAGLREG